MKTVWYLVPGTGCFDSSAQNEKEYISSWTGIPTEDVKYRCPKTSSAIKCIVKTYLRYNPLRDSKFVRDLAIEICQDLLMKNGDEYIYKNVVVFGQSYGGAVVNRVAELLNEAINLTQKKIVDNFKLSLEDLKRLYIATFGSIYVAHDDNVNDINIINYVSASDVAILCNKIDPIPFSDMTISLIRNMGLGDNPVIICKLPHENGSKTKQICLYGVNTTTWESSPLCVSSKDATKLKLPSIRDWSEHDAYTNLKESIFRNFRFDKSISNFINVYDFIYGVNANIRLPYLVNDKEIDATPDASLGGKRKTRKTRRKRNKSKLTHKKRIRRNPRRNNTFSYV